MNIRGIALLTLATVAFAQPAARKITFNGKSLTADQLQRLTTVESFYGVRIPDRDYWYDNRSGAVGIWKGPTAAFLPAGLGLGGPMPANCSTGGTGVFINGRELHPVDVAALQTLGPVFAGRYWVDGNGFFGLEGGAALGNLFLLARPAKSRPSSPHRVYAPGELSGLIGNPEVGFCTDSGNCSYRQ